MYLTSLQASLTNSDVIFLKLHAPWDVLCRYAELMNIRMPFRLDKTSNDANVKIIKAALSNFLVHKQKLFACSVM